nr:hormone-sensitive lipase [Loxodonta africana]
MKSGRTASLVREITVEPGSKSVSRPDWEPEPSQRLKNQQEPGPEKTLTMEPGSNKTQQEYDIRQEPASQQRPLTQQESFAQHEAESQQETRAQQKSSLQQEPAPQQSPSTHPEATSQQEGKESMTQQEPELRAGHVAQPEPGSVKPPLAQVAAESTSTTWPRPEPKQGPPAQVESTSQERSEQEPDPTTQQTSLAQTAKSQQGSLTEWGFLAKLQEQSLQRSAAEWKTFFEWATDSDSESDLGSPSETDSPVIREESGAQRRKLRFKRKPGYEVMSGYGGTSPNGKRTKSQNYSYYGDTASRLTHGMDLRTMTQSLVTLAEDNIAFFSSQGPGETARRLLGVFAGVREQALGLEPTLGRLLGMAHLFDLDSETPANGYRSLVHTARCCLAHLLHKSRYVASNRRSIFFRSGHNLAELEAYLAALTQLRALAYYAQRLLITSQPGRLFLEGDEGLTADFLREYVTLHKGCFYGRCLGFQFTPTIRPFLQTISIGLVSFGEHYKRNETVSIDYSLAPEAPFPRALEECFYAYCWAVKHCALLGSTGERICLAGDSAGGNLCFTVSLRAAAYGVRVPDGIMAAYPATMLQSSASPSRLLSLMDPLLPLSVLSKCVSAYAGAETEDHSDSDQKALGMMGLVRRDTALLLRDLRMGASSWLNSFLELSGRKSHKTSVPIAEPVPVPMRRSVSEAALAQPEGPLGGDPVKSLTMQDLSLRSSSEASDTPKLSLSGETLGPSKPSDVNFLLGPEDVPEAAVAMDEVRTQDHCRGTSTAFPEGFHPRRSSQGATRMPLDSSPIVKNPFMSPLLAPDYMLQSLPPVHIVACALDPMLDDSVMFARRLRSLGQPVTLRVVEDLPHGFLSLAALCRETREAAALCVERIRLVLTPPGTSAPAPHGGLERQTAPATPPRTPPA